MRPQSSSSLTGHGQATLWPNIPSRVQGTGAHPNPQPWSNIISSPRNLPPNHRPSSQPFQRQGNLNSNLFGFPTGVQYGIHGNFLGTSIARDALLAYAHRLYNNAFNHPLGLTPVPHQSQPDSGLPNTHHQQLISLLESIKSQHPRHLPTLLLLSCVQFSIGNYDTCASLCDEILSIDGNYVEAISNLGMVMKVKGAITEAESLWMKAIKLRPTYWDAIDNLLHVLCEPATLPNGVVVPPRYHEAIGVLDHVLNILIRADGLLLVFIPPAHLHRLQNLLYTSGNLRAVIKSDPRAALHDHTRGLELIFRPPGSIEVGNPLHFRDIIIATVVIGLLANELPNSPVLTSIANVMDIDSVRFTSNMLDRGVDWLALVHGAGEKLVEVLLNQGKGALPMILLTPEKVSRIPETLFSVFSRILPALCVRASYEHPWVPAAGADDPGATKVTSTILLSIAKCLQSKDISQGGGAFGPGRPLPRSLSLIIIIYYLAISLNPTPSTYNNMGILFYMVKNSATTINAQGNREVINGFVLAQLYYKKGLSMDPSHPHLLTNYGSLLKDQGRPLEAVRMYKKALEINPDFDVALANIANLVKDSGNIPEAVSYYQRALAVSPNFPDVICGFVNAMSSICDWRGGRGSTAKQPMVDDQLNLIFREEGDHAPRGWMGKLETVTKKQLLEGYGVGEGIMRTFGELKEWRGIVQLALGQDLPDLQRRHWDKILGRFYGPFNRYEKAVNETGFVIRLIELLNRITQQRWYRDHYVQESGTGVASSKLYRRFRLPGAMEPPPVPSVLPFHTFTYSLETRVLRLVAYRNALKISYDALMAPWLPTTVYQPPPPPTDRFNIGYVSSDFNNHPLSHLMLSVFGLHDRSRYKVHAYATSSSDNSYYRHRIEEDAEVFRDVSTQSTQSIVTQINTDNIHVLVNLGGYTKAARNDIFAARPCPIQVSLMGYAGTSAASWCDYIVGDERACPKDTFSPWRVAQRKKNGEETSRLQDGFTMLDLETDMPQEADPESLSEDWAFTERFLHMPHSYFVTDHRQSFPEDHSGPSIPAETSWLLEERLRYKLRQEIFPELSS
ncbi:protein prenylyltransferase [Serendipita vermifera]|nr:protein prenylyltransferase [Serendipita vermifera]